MSCQLRDHLTGAVRKCWIKPDKATGYWKAEWRIKFTEYSCLAVKIEDGLYEALPGTESSKPYVLSKGRYYAGRKKVTGDMSQLQVVGI